MSQFDSILPWLKCPTCGYLDLLEAEGEFVCLACDIHYTIIDGVPDFAPHVRQDSAAGYIQQKYERDASEYEWQMRHWSLPLLGGSAEEMSALAESVACGGGWLLEVPVGTGDFSFEVYRNQRQTRVVAVDLAWAMLHRAQQRAKELDLTDLILIRADVACLPFKDNVFDALLTLNGFHIFPDETAALKNLQAVIKPGARIAGSCPVAGADGLAGWLMKTFQKAKNVRQVTIESMTTQVQACWPTAEIARSGAILTFKRACNEAPVNHCPRFALHQCPRQ